MTGTGFPGRNRLPWLFSPSMAAAALFMVIFLSRALAVSPRAAVGPASRPLLPELRFVDFHSHILRGQEDVSGLIEIMKRNRIDTMALSGLVWKEPDRHVLEAVVKDPDRFVAFLRGFEPDREYSIDYVQNQLATGKFKGIGELFINGHGRRVPGDHPVLRVIYQLAAEYRVPVLLHWTIGSVNPAERGTREDYQALKRVLRENPATAFILAHCGLGPRPFRPVFPQVLAHLLSKYPNLYLDLSGLHEELLDAQDRKTELGKALFALMAKHPSRFLGGFDFGETAANPAQAASVIRKLWLFVCGLTPEKAVKVIRGNALQMLGRCHDPSVDKRPRPLLIRGDKGFLPYDYPIPEGPREPIQSRLVEYPGFPGPGTGD